MTKEETNNQPSVPDEGQTDEGLVVTEDYDKLSDEELEARVKGTPASVEPAPVTETPGPAKPVLTEELPDDLKGKSAEELAKAYINVRKLHAKQDAELGELRTFKQKADELNNIMKESHIDATARQFVNKTMQEMTQDQKDNFFELLSKDPAAAIMPMVEESIKPIVRMTASQANNAEIERLKNLHNDNDRVPFDLTEVNEVLKQHNDANGVNDLFSRYGSKAYEAAYKEVRANKLESVLEKEKQEAIEKAKREAEEAALAKSRTYTEPQGVTNIESGAIDFENIPLEKFDEIVGKPEDY